MTEQGPQVTWKEYYGWRASLTHEQRVMGGAQGQWPEGTPQVFIDIYARLTPGDKLLHSIFSNKPSIEEVLARPADYLQMRVPTPSPVSHQLLKEQVEDVLDSLTERERKVMYSRFGLIDGRSRTQAEVGEEIGRSRWTVGRIERRALSKLRRPSRSQTLRDYLA